MIAEPTTMLTDYALAGVTGWLAWSLFRSREGQRSRSLWALAFAALALGAALGGTWHGFAPLFAETAVLLLWKATVFSVRAGLKRLRGRDPESRPARAGQTP